MTMYRFTDRDLVNRLVGNKVLPEVFEVVANDEYSAQGFTHKTVGLYRDLYCRSGGKNINRPWHIQPINLTYDEKDYV